MRQTMRDGAVGMVSSLASVRIASHMPSASELQAWVQVAGAYLTFAIGLASFLKIVLEGVLKVLKLWRETRRPQDKDPQ